ncbi:hypothetical protein LOK49_LG11G01004 [Camellia lanceoleosa]|uniref:Uncharacterized protein n=1 Tax=Camellia lanceoleosa TaxID=1840588 RepID=A0ACC0G310_9ERIC|nr:hypothetical protein LOK49_LG11G01004 [Camellia lanceoleosa]
MKKAIFEEQTAKALKKWQKAARARKKLRKKEGGTPDNSVSGVTSGENTSSRGSSPIYLLHKHKVSSSAGPELESVPNSSTSYQFDLDTELSETEIFAHGRHDSMTRPQVAGQPLLRIGLLVVTKFLNKEISIFSWCN